MVIDWRNREEGPPGLDWAMSAVILAQAAAVLHAGHTPMPSPAGPLPATGPELASEGRVLLTALTGHAARDRLQDCLPEAVARRAANPTLSPLEVSCLDQAPALILSAT